MYRERYTAFFEGPPMIRRLSILKTLGIYCCKLAQNSWIKDDTNKKINVLLRFPSP
jgi:hypothetical protein